MNYQHLVRNLPNGALYLFDRDLRYVAAGGRGMTDSGLRPEDVVGKTLHEVWGPEQTKVSEPICRAALAGKTTIVEEPFQGKIYWVITSPWRGDGDRILGGVVLAMDITDLRAVRYLESDTKKDLELKARALDAADNGIVIVDALASDMPVVYVNKGFQNMTGYAPSDVLGKKCRFLQGDDPEQDGTAVLADAFRRQKSATVVLRNYRADGSLIWNELSVSPVLEHNRVTHYIGILHDVTSRFSAEGRPKDTPV